MRTIETLLPRSAATISREASADEACRGIRDAGVDALVVLDGPSRVVGIITATDVLGLDDLTTPLAILMSTEVLTVSPHTAVADAAQAMRAHHIRHLVVTDHAGAALGVISAFDLLEAIVPVATPAAADPVDHRVRAGLRARAGDTVVVRGKAIDQRTRRGLITEVRGPDGNPPFVVRWLDDPHAEPHSVLYFPGSDADIEPSQPA